jgi:hypothetical protein
MNSFVRFTEHCEPTDLTKALLEHYKVESERLSGFVSLEPPPAVNKQGKKPFLAAAISAAYGFRLHPAL